jgi:hypothetical protein
LNAELRLDRVRAREYEQDRAEHSADAKVRSGWSRR